VPRRSALILLALFAFTPISSAADAPRPNILWITSEDNSPYLGCYGDKLAQTPHLDRLAAEGVRYQYAFANAPVCSTARTTLITGMYACSLGVHHHRSRVRIPDAFPLYPEVFRAAGYYCTNNSKTDYNLADRPSPWDESSNQAHYRNRSDGQPFFAVFNFTTSHESQVAPKPGKTTFRVSPQDIVLPPYHPDTPEIRRDWANYYDQMTAMDAQVGEKLAELDRLGLADDTIVCYYSDHGGALPGGKRSLHDRGTRVPLIIRFPQNWQHFAPAQPGEWCDDLVSFVDFPATALSLAGIPLPRNYQGVPFLGEQKAAPREHVFLYRGRMDERYDEVRAIRDRQYRYVRNDNPELPQGQQYSYPFQVQPSMRSWYAEYTAGRCNEIQSRHWQPKPSEELYDVAADPFETDNLAANPAHAERLAAMRQTLDAEMLAIRDTGLIPEGMFERLRGERTIYDYAQSDAYPLAEVLPLANLATSRGRCADFLPLRDAPHPLVRYWGMVGVKLSDDWLLDSTMRGAELLDDEFNDVRVVAAEALIGKGPTDRKLNALADVLSTGNLYEQLAALNALDRFVDSGAITRAAGVAALPKKELPEPASRIVGRLRGGE